MSIIAGFPSWGGLGVMTKMNTTYAYSVISDFVVIGKEFLLTTISFGRLVA